MAVAEARVQPTRALRKFRLLRFEILSRRPAARWGGGGRPMRTGTRNRYTENFPKLKSGKPRLFSQRIIIRFNKLFRTFYYYGLYEFFTRVRAQGGTVYMSVYVCVCVCARACSEDKGEASKMTINILIIHTYEPGCKRGRNPTKNVLKIK